MSHPPEEAGTQRKLLEAMRAVLSDDHNYERGLAALRGMVDRIARDGGEAELRDFTVALSLALAEALDRGLRRLRCREGHRRRGLEQQQVGAVHLGARQEDVGGARAVGPTQRAQACVDFGAEREIFRIL